MANALNFILNEGKRYASIPYKEGAGNNNKFSTIVNAYGLAGCQNQPWCATYQFALELMAFGKSVALKHWNMTDGYVGYSCFETEAKFKKAGKTGSVPKKGALVIFKKSHMGRVVSMNTSKKTFVCMEGNSGDRCVLKTYSYTDSGIKSFCYIDYGSNTLTAAKVHQAVKAAYEMAHYLKWKYGDSHSYPPCIGDSTIACDRLIALAFYVLGYTDMPAGGFTVLNMESYMKKYGLTKITNANALKDYDIILFKQDGTSSPTPFWHAFELAKLNSLANISKYDCGEGWRIESKQPFTNVAFDQWPNKSFYCAFRVGKGPSGRMSVDEVTFDAAFYSDMYPDLRKAFGTNKTKLREHWDTFGKKEGRRANVLFDAAYYKRYNKELKYSNAKYISHFYTTGMKAGKRPSLIFSPAYYKRTYPDLKKAFGSDWTKYYEHFITYGMKEGRKPSSTFDPKAYKKRYKDLAKAFGDNWPMYYQHWIVYGKKEGRKGT